MAIARPLRTFGRVLKDVREGKGKKVWTQKYVAKAARLHHFSVSKAENDADALTLDTYLRITRALGTTIEAVVAEMDPDAPLPESIRAFLGHTAGVESSSVRIANRTRYSEAEPLDKTWTRLTTVGAGEEPGMPTDPYFQGIQNFWPDFDDAAKAEALSAIAKIHGHRKRAVGESPGK